MMFESLARGLTDDIDFDAEALGTAAEFMSPDPIVASPDEPIKAVARQMAEERVHRVIFVDDQRLVLGIATSLDLLKAFPD